MGRVSPVNLVYQVCLVHLVQPSTGERPNGPDRLDRPNSTNQINEITVLLEVSAAFDRLEQCHLVGILNIHSNRNTIGDTGDPNPERL